MTNFFRFFVAILTVVGATSCANEFSHIAQQTADVTITTSLNGLESRLIADGSTVDELAWAVYLDGKTTPHKNMCGTVALQNKQATLNLRLATGQTYDIVFFAYKSAEAKAIEEVGRQPNPKYYSVDWSKQSVEVLYEDGKTIANDEERDCFWHVVDNLKVEGPITKTFKLKRPLAQLNLGVEADDVLLAKECGFQITHTAIRVESYNAFNVISGNLIGEPEIVFFTKSAIPDMNTEQLVIAGSDTSYEYLSTTYVLVNEQRTCNIEVDLWDVSGIVINTLKYSFVPFRRNYRTNIVGSLLTNPATFTIVVDHKFDDDYIINHWSGDIKSVSEQNGVYSITEAAELAWIAQQVNTGNSYAGKTVVLANDIDLNATVWEPIGGANGKFSGTFDGQGYTIANLTVKNNEYAGLFVQIYPSATVKRVNVKNATIESSHFAGVIAGYAYGNITDCQVDNAQITVVPNMVNGSYDNGDKAGGIVGYVGESSYSIANNKVTNTTIRAYRDLGGIAGCVQGTSTVTANEGSNITIICDQQTNSYGAKDTNAGAVVGRTSVDLSTNNVSATIDYLL